MKRFSMTFMVFVSLVACKNNKDTATEQSLDTATTVTNQTTDSAKSATAAGDTTVVAAKSSVQLLLNTGGLQYIDTATGSTKMLAFGMDMDGLVSALNNIVGSKAENIELNKECGAGPRKFAKWKNGLSVQFAESKSKSGSVWKFTGWSLGSDADKSLTTMTGIGIGSTRTALEKAHKVKITTSTIGEEFLADGNLSGVLSGKKKDATVTDLWAGESCIFR